MMFNLHWRVGWLAASLVWMTACATPMAMPSLTPTKAATNTITTAPIFTRKASHTPSSTMTLFLTPSPLFTPSRTPVIIPVSSQVKLSFTNYFSRQGYIWKVKINLIDLAYEKNKDGSLVLKIAIQCVPGDSPCESNMTRYAFIGNFADPVPDPVRMAIFPATLKGFKVYGYDENMTLIDSVAGKWSDLMDYERGVIPLFELENLFTQP